MDTLKQHKATIIALTPQVPEHSRPMVEKHKLSFDILSDPGNGYADQLGLRFTVPDDLQEVYRSFGIDLPKHNGEPSWTLPMPARLVIDAGGIVRAVDADPDYTRRPEPAATVAEVAALT